MTLPDFSHLSAIQFSIVLIAVAAFDFATGVVGAIGVTKTFTWAQVLNILESHGLKRVLPLALLFAVGQAASSPPLVALADGALAVYVYETLISAVGNLTGAAPKAAATVTTSNTRTTA